MLTHQCSHTEDVMVFLFPFGRHFAHWWSFRFLGLACIKADRLPQSTAVKGLDRLSPSTTGKYEADPVYVCVTSKAADMLLSLKNQSCFPSSGVWSSKSERPLGPCRQTRVLCRFPRAASDRPRCTPHCTPGMTRSQSCDFIKNRGHLALNSL